jgi:hypothetical protein
MVEPMHCVSDAGTSYASVIEEMQSMYLLSFLLTADHDKAEQCPVFTMGEAPEGIGVFVDWTRLWARRAVIKHAIDLIVPAPEHADDVSRISLTEPARWADNIPFAAVLFWTRSSVLSSSCRFWKGSPMRNALRNALRRSRRDVIDGPRAGSPASIKHGCQGPLEFLHRLRECMTLEHLTRKR